MNPDNYQPKGNYASASHNHAGVYQPVGSYATTTELNEVKTSVSNGKSAVASAITDKGVSTSATASFDTMASNIRKIDMVSTSFTLPTGYTQVNYIQTDGNAWVNTGISTNSYTAAAMTITIVCDYPITTSYIQKPLFAVANDDSNYPMYISQSYSTYRYSNFKLGSVTVPTEVIYHDRIGKIKYFIKYTSQYATGANDAYPNSFGTLNCRLGANSKNSMSVYGGVMYLWANGYNKASKTSGGGFPGSKIYEFIFYYNNSLVSHMIPCRSSAGVPGFYDVTRKAFYGNSGTGSLTYG